MRIRTSSQLVQNKICSLEGNWGRKGIHPIGRDGRSPRSPSMVYGVSVVDTIRFKRVFQSLV